MVKKLKAFQPRLDTRKSVPSHSFCFDIILILNEIIGQQKKMYTDWEGRHESVLFTDDMIT